ncbi:DEAD/DEAH box helicase family protein [Duganella sp. CT11-25]|uniref:DEAD/DEAH box helicase family protein n=1 Tax=unclassified Duganella TaxID=2636909 RepID=UPI0039B04ADB
MAFKTPQIETIVPESPDRLFRDLTRRRLPDVLPHQAEIMRKYAAEAVDQPDVALQLPTGSGKTLVGLLIAEWRRRKFRERIVYLCPTIQLVNQVAAEAHDKYGLSVAKFIGQIKDYSPADKTDYQLANRIAVTTYSALFNTNPFFDDADIILVDDAHVSENYIAKQWTIVVPRASEEHAALHRALTNVLEPHLSGTDLTRLRGVWDDIVDRTWVDKVPTPTLAEIADELIEVFDAHTANTKLAYPWSVIRSHLLACQMYISSNEILIRPLLPPTFSHASFIGARQRIFMSATLGAGGDLERLTGRKEIYRIPAPAGWDTQGVGRRFFIFPEMSLKQDDIPALRTRLMKRGGRSVVLVPSETAANKTAEDITKTMGVPVFSARDIEDSKMKFVSQPNAVAVIANRYDGVDFAGDDCRLLFIDGLPKAMNSQERFLMSRMGANTLYNERIQTRVVQAIGRCTRSLEDFSAIVITGEELPDYLTDLRRRRYLHPELQAEINFGVRQSLQTDAANIYDNFEIFLENEKDWEQVNNQIVDERSRLIQEQMPAVRELQQGASFEVDYQMYMWRKDYESAVEAAERVLGVFTSRELRGYQALWHYLAGSAAHLASIEGNATMSAKARAHFVEAHQAAPDISWLAKFARQQRLIDWSPKIEARTAILTQVERLAANLTRLGTTQDREFANLEASIMDGLRKPETFESAQKSLGDLLGFVAHKVEREGSPDPWWISGEQCVVFEDYVNTTHEGTLSVEKARQAASHPNWMTANVQEAKGCAITTILVSPARRIRRAALAHVGDVRYWDYQAFVDWADKALRTIRDLRRDFSEAGDLLWQARAVSAIQDNGLDLSSIIEAANLRSLADYMTPE